MFYVNREDCQHAEKHYNIFFSEYGRNEDFVVVGTDKEEQCYHCDLIAFYSHLLLDSEFCLCLEQYLLLSYRSRAVG